MRVEKNGIGFSIVRGRVQKSYFCFLVDDDRAVWARAHPQEAQMYESARRAADMMSELKRRTGLRRSRRVFERTPRIK